MEAEIDDKSAASLIPQLPALAAPAQAGALKAFSQLLGGAGGYLSAWLRRPTQAVNDKTDARSLIASRIAEAAALQASQDPQIIACALENWLPGELKKQKNKATVVEKTIYELSINDEDLSSSSEIIEDDWLNSFERFCEDASSDKMQTLWSKVLAGEIIKPGSFGRPTLRSLYELDKETAVAFEAIAQYAINNAVLGAGDSDRLLFSQMIHLDAAGILSGVGGLLHREIKCDTKGIFRVRESQYLLLGISEPEANISIDGPSFSKVGRELLKIVPNNDVRKSMIRLGERLKEPHLFNTKKIKGVHLLKLEGDPPDARILSNDKIWGEDLPI